jgi:molecular chaperone DnaK
MTHRIGIDLGTTNSAVAYTDLGRQRCVKVEENRFTSAVMPSCVGLAPDGRLVVGTPAANLYENFARDFKRGIGSDMTWQLGGTGYSALELSTLLVKTLADGFVREVGSVEGAVITVPANFPDRKRHETKEAGRLAGLDVLRIINEPSAAAIAYTVAGQALGENVLVIDWGGGTLDVSLVDAVESVLDIKSNDGKAECGGINVDQLLYDLARRKGGPQLRDAVKDPAVSNPLLRKCEEIKVHLSGAKVWDEPMAFKRRVGPSLVVDVEVTRAELEELARPLVDQVVAAARRCLAKAPEGALEPTDVSDVILVGGSCLIPLLQQEVERVFGRKGRIDLNPMEVVALGAAYQAQHARETGSTVVVHSLATSLGVRSLGFDHLGVPRHDQFTAILPATTKLPARQTHTFGTVHDNQESVRVEVYETELESVTGLEPWDTREITGLPEVPAGSFDIDITFDYNTEQVLEVTVAIPDHGIRESWKPRFLHRLEGGREESKAKIDRLLDARIEGLRAYEARVARVLAEGANAPRSCSLLADLRRELEAENVESAKRIKDKLGEALFDEGIML